MASDKTAEAAIPLTRLPGLRPFAHVFDRLSAGHLRIRLGDFVHELHGSEPGPAGELRIHRPLQLARRLATKSHVGLGEAYLAGDWDSPDPAALLHVLAVNEHRFNAVERVGPLHRVLSLLKHRRRRNSRSGSRRNIAYHYDLGNDFYRLWLDPSMTYSAGVFEREQDTLERAQHNKYRRMLDLIGAKPGDHVLEIGCGWGGFARAAAERGLQVTGVTLSTEQLAWARGTIAATPFASQVELRLQDYRDLDGQFDHIVSIEMFEAVGDDYWDTYMAQLCRCLRPGGRAALQIITIDESMFEDYKANPDFIQQYIFPGGMLPSVERFDALTAKAGLKIASRSFHALDYARTLALWHQRFLEHEDDVGALGYDERFIRMWRYYLAYCEAGFRDERINVMQVVLEHETT
jgi:cyclopropane-fatty-acyl-phospholipid synthase